MIRAGYAAFYNQLGGLLTGQALADQTLARAVAGTPYELRPSARQHCRLVGSTWLDQDTSGTFVGPGEKARSPSPGPSRAPRTPSDPDLPKKPKNLSEQLARQTGKRLFLIFSPSDEIVIHKLKAIGTGANNWPYGAKYNKIIEELPASSERMDGETNPYGLRKRSIGTENVDENAILATDSNPPDTSVETTDDGRPYPTIGHPAARGCKNCFNLNIECGLLDRDNPHYPCRHCEEEDEVCELCIEPKLKAACYWCKKGRKACSYSSTDDEKEHAVPCVHCNDDARVCAAGPRGVKKVSSKNGSQTRRALGVDEDTDPADVAGWSDRKTSSSTSQASDHGGEAETDKPVEKAEKIDKPEGSDKAEAKQQVDGVDKILTAENLEGNDSIGEVAEHGGAGKIEETDAKPMKPADTIYPSLETADKPGGEDHKDEVPTGNEDPLAELFEDNTSAEPALGEEQASTGKDTKVNEVGSDKPNDEDGGLGEPQADNTVEKPENKDEGLQMPYDTHSGKVDIPEQPEAQMDEYGKDTNVAEDAAVTDKQDLGGEEQIDPELQKLLDTPHENGDSANAIHGLMDDDLFINTDEISMLQNDADDNLLHTTADMESKETPKQMPTAPMFPNGQTSIFGDGLPRLIEDITAAAPTTNATSQQDNKALSGEAMSGLQSLASKAITKVIVENNDAKMVNHQPSHSDKNDPTQGNQSPIVHATSPRKRKREGSDEAGPSRPNKTPAKAGHSFAKVTAPNDSKQDALAIAAENSIHGVPPPAKKKKTFPSSKLFCLDDDDEEEEEEDINQYVFLRRHAEEDKKKEKGVEEEGKKQEQGGNTEKSDVDMGGCDSIWGLAKEAAGGERDDAGSSAESVAVSGFKKVDGLEKGMTAANTKQRNMTANTMKKEKSYKSPSVIDDEDMSGGSQDFSANKPIAPIQRSNIHRSKPLLHLPQASTSRNISHTNRAFNKSNSNRASPARSSPRPYRLLHHRPSPSPQTSDVIDLTAPSSSRPSHFSRASTNRRATPSSEQSAQVCVSAKERQLWLARRAEAKLQREIRKLEAERGNGGDGSANGWPPIPHNMGRMHGGNGSGGGGFERGEMVDLTDSAAAAGSSIGGGGGGGAMNIPTGQTKKRAYKEIIELDDSD